MRSRSTRPARTRSIAIGQVLAYRKTPVITSSRSCSIGIGIVSSLAPMPVSTRVPPGRTAAMPARIALGAPEASMNASTSRPSVAMSSSRGSIARVAPNVSACSSRAAETSEMMISVAPNAFATCAVTTPIGPAPAISTRDPALTPAFCTEAMPTESGSMSAAASSLMLSGTGQAKCAWIGTYCWNAPSVPGTA